MRGIKVAGAAVGLSAALAGTAVGLAGPTSAATRPSCTPEGTGTYPPAASPIALDRSRASVGMAISFEARCFDNGDTVTATVYSTPKQVGTFTANSSGVVSGEFTVPQVEAGRHTLRLVGSDGTQTSVGFTVVPSAAPAAGGTGSSTSGSLAFTGTDVAMTAGVGALLLLGGGALVMAAKRRKHVNAAV
jgi:hypothetical protein